MRSDQFSRFLLLLTQVALEGQTSTRSVATTAFLAPPTSLPSHHLPAPHFQKNWDKIHRPQISLLGYPGLRVTFSWALQQWCEAQALPFLAGQSRCWRHSPRPLAGPCLCDHPPPSFAHIPDMVITTLKHYALSLWHPWLWPVATGSLHSLERQWRLAPARRQAATSCRQLSQQLKTPATSGSCSTSHLSPITLHSFGFNPLPGKLLKASEKGNSWKIYRHANAALLHLLLPFCLQTCDNIRFGSRRRVWSHLGGLSWGVWVHNCRPICSRGAAGKRHSCKRQLRRHDQFTGRYSSDSFGQLEPPGRSREAECSEKHLCRQLWHTHPPSLRDDSQ